jgi:hypothetical protein
MSFEFTSQIKIKSNFAIIDMLAKAIKLSVSYNNISVSKLYDKFPRDAHSMYTYYSSKQLSNEFLNLLINKRMINLMTIFPYPIAYDITYNEIDTDTNKIFCECNILLHDGFLHNGSCFVYYNTNMQGTLLSWIMHIYSFTIYNNITISFSNYNIFFKYNTNSKHRDPQIRLHIDKKDIVTIFKRPVFPNKKLFNN